MEASIVQTLLLGAKAGIFNHGVADIYTSDLSVWNLAGHAQHPLTRATGNVENGRRLGESNSGRQQTNLLAQHLGLPGQTSHFGDVLSVGEIGAP
jgi:hypothetical protein